MDIERRIHADPGELARAVAGELVRLAKDAAKRKGRFAVALAGGTTPRAAYQLLATHPVFRELAPWRQMHFFWGDERCVPPAHAESNFRMAQEALLSRVPVPPANMHRIPAELPDAADAAARYEQDLQAFFKISPGKFPKFDLVLLGVGTDGHTASLFPGSDALADKQRSVRAVSAPANGVARITLTLPVLNAAACVLFIASGPDKAEIVARVLGGDATLPAARVRPSGRLVWMLDRAAAAKL